MGERGREEEERGTGGLVGTRRGHGGERKGEEDSFRFKIC
jgi:hypothetical protein